MSLRLHIGDCPQQKDFTTKYKVYHNTLRSNRLSMNISLPGGHKADRY